MRGDGAGAPTTKVSIFSRGWWTKKRLIGVGSIAGTLIGVLAIVVPIAVTAADRSTSDETIKVDAEYASEDGEGLAAEPERLIEPVAAGLSASADGASSIGELYVSEWYAVPVDAPWEEFFAFPTACDPATWDWLKTHGKPVLPRKITSQITNSATTGSVATISKIRAQGELTAPPVPTLKVGAMSCSGEGAEGIYATMALGVDPVAVFDDCYDPRNEWPCAGSSEDVPVPGDPVVFDLAPGETNTVNLSWTQTMDFVGRFVADLTVDGTTTVIDISPGAADLDVPVVTRPDDTLYYDMDYLWCEAGPDAHYEVCDLDTWLSIVAAE